MYTYILKKEASLTLQLGSIKMRILFSEIETPFGYFGLRFIFLSFSLPYLPPPPSSSLYSSTEVLRHRIFSKKGASVFSCSRLVSGEQQPGTAPESDVYIGEKEARDMSLAQKCKMQKEGIRRVSSYRRVTRLSK
jgi:hypothetical protein